MDIDQIKKELERYNRVFPREALKEAIARKEEITPFLLDALVYAKDNAEELINDNYMAHTYALYLLAQFREKRAYPLIIDLFSLPGDITLDLTGDIVTEDLGRMLASVSCGDTSLIKQLAENEAANEYVRDSAIRALICLMAEGELPREEVVTYFKSLFHTNLPKGPNLLVNFLVSCAVDIYPEELYEEVKEAFDKGLVDEWFMDLKFVESRLKEEKESALARLKAENYIFIRDTIAEMEQWDSFQPSKPTPVIYKPKPVVNKPQTVVNKQKVGRNEPCPCGSGKKYKKCCGQ
jgi:hypothetical protein